MAASTAVRNFQALRWPSRGLPLHCLNVHTTMSGSQTVMSLGPRRVRIVSLFGGSFIALLGGMLGCGGDSTSPTTGQALRGANETYWTLQLNHHAINMATVPSYNTVQLTATPLNPSGVALTGLGRVTFHVGDSAVTVDSTGLVTAHYSTQGTPTPVVASLTAQNYTLVDTAYIQVTDTAPQHPLVTFSLQPAVGDSAKRAVFSSLNVKWPVTATTAAEVVCDVSHCPLLVAYTSSNPRIAQIDPQHGQVTMNDTGHVVFTATTYAYGVAWRDSVVFTCGFSILQWLSVQTVAGTIAATGQDGQYPNSTMVLGVGAVVTWTNYAQPAVLSFPAIVSQPIAVIFDDTTNVDTASQLLPLGTIFNVGPPTGTGNIPAFGADTINYDDYRSRRFPVAGTYRWHTSLSPADTFTIVIKPGP